MVALVAIFLAAVKSVGTAGILFAWSAILAWRGAIDQTLLSRLSYLSKVMFIPALAFQSISVLSQDFFADHWFLILLGTSFLGMGFAFGFGLATLIRIRQDMRPWFILIIAVPNMNGLPLVIVEALCREERQDQGEIAQCLAGGTAVLFTVTLTHNFIIWGLIFPWLEASLTALEPQVAEVASLAVPAGWTSTPAVDDAPASDGHPTPSKLGSPSGEMSLQRSESIRDEPQTGLRCSIKRLLEILQDNPPVLATMLAAVVALTPRVQALLYGPQAVGSFLASCIAIVGKAGPAVTSIVVGGSFGIQISNVRQNKEVRYRDAFQTRITDLGLSKSFLGILVVGRILMVPAVNFLLTIILWPVLPPDQWTRIILCFQPASVTANIITVFAQLTKKREAAELIAFVTLPQMLLYVPTATTLIALGIYWSEDVTTSR